LIVVSDTSPILNLARISRLELLPSLYQQVLIPDAVYEELTDSRRNVPPAITLDCTSWLVVVTVADQDRVRALRGNLDAGEAEAIALAIELRAELLLMDERRGRQRATAAGLKVVGLIGIVARAKRAGLIDHAKPVLDELIRTARFWIGSELYAEVLGELGEVRGKS